jgi:hypothetical protein
MDIEQARSLAEQYMAKLFGSDHRMMVYENEFVTDRGWCFLFPWNTARYAETHDISDALGPGFGPIVVVKQSGDVWMMNSLPEEDQLAEYAAEHGIDVSR